jgi:hypothetical protein
MAVDYGWGTTGTSGTSGTWTSTSNGNAFLSVDLAADYPLTIIQQLRKDIGSWLKPLI